MKLRKIIFAAGALIFITGLSYWFSVTKSFSESEWKSPHSTRKSSFTRSERQKMLRDVINIIENKSKQEIIQILGPGNKVGYFPGSEKGLVYLLGPERGLFGIDSEWLLISFDKNEMFDDYEIAND